MFAKYHSSLDALTINSLLGLPPSKPKDPPKPSEPVSHDSPVRQAESVRNRKELVDRRIEEELAHRATAFHSKFETAKTRKSRFDENRHSSLVQHRDRRDRRTLRSKVTKVLTSLPRSCTHYDKESKAEKDVRRKELLQKLNEIREKKGFEPLDNYQFNSDDEVDDRGNVVSKGHIPAIRYTPRSELRRVLSKEQIQALSQDPTYYVQKKEYRKAVGELDRRSWEQLLNEKGAGAGSARDSAPKIRAISEEMYQRLSPLQTTDMGAALAQLSVREEQFEARQRQKAEEMMEKARKQMSRSEAALQRLRELELANMQKAENERRKIDAKMRLAEKNASVEQLKKARQSLKASSQYEEHKDKVLRHQLTETLFKDKVKTLNDMTNEYAEQFAQTLRQSRIMKKLEKVGSSLKRWQEKRISIQGLEEIRENKRLEKVAAIKTKLAHSESARTALQQDYVQMVREFNEKHRRK